MKTFKVITVVLIGGFTLATSLMFGKAEYTKKEKKACTFCHVKAGSKDLNDVGKCYEKNKHSLEGCEPKDTDKK